MKRLNKKGFTLVELLAVIVILALIMAIAIYSISGILQSSRENVFKETALNVINGVKMQLLSTNELKVGDYYFTPNILDNDNELPFGGKINYATGTELSGDKIGVGVYRVNGDASLSCSQTGKSFVKVTYDTKYNYRICLTSTDTTSASAKYIYGTEAELSGGGTGMILPS